MQCLHKHVQHLMYLILKETKTCQMRCNRLPKLKNVSKVYKQLKLTCYRLTIMILLLLVESFVRKFKQQTLPGWQPLFSARSTFPWMFASAIIFIPVGILLYVNSEGLKEIKIDYTNCKSVDKPSETCADLIRSPATYNQPCQCYIRFKIEDPLDVSKTGLNNLLCNFYNAMFVSQLEWYYETIAKFVLIFSAGRSANVLCFNKLLPKSSSLCEI